MKNYKVGFYVENNPYLEVPGSTKYPMIRFYSGYIKMIADALGADEIAIIPMTGNTKELKGDRYDDTDIFYLNKHLKVDLVRYDDENITFDNLFSTNLQGRLLNYIINLENMMDRVGKFFYFDTDTECTFTNKVSLFRYLEEHPNDLELIRSKINVIISEGTSMADPWNKYAKSLTFIPYIVHPYYLETPRIAKNEDREYDVATMRSTSSSRIYNLLETSYKLYPMVGKDLSVVTVGLKEMDRKLSKCHLLLGTMLNYVTDHEYRSTSKIMESLHAGCLPTTYCCDPKLLVDGRYPYLEEMPKELRILDKSKNVKNESIAKAIDLAKSYNDDMVCDMYEKLKLYHHPNNWIDKMKEVLNA